MSLHLVLLLPPNKHVTAKAVWELLTLRLQLLEVFRVHVKCHEFGRF